jgi:hypothetical protein
MEGYIAKPNRFRLIGGGIIRIRVTFEVQNTMTRKYFQPVVFFFFKYLCFTVLDSSKETLSRACDWLRTVRSESLRRNGYLTNPCVLYASCFLAHFTSLVSTSDNTV